MIRLYATLLTAILLLGAPQPARAAGKLVAAILSSDIARYREAHRSFIRSLAQRGYDQGNIEVVVQSPNPDAISWANAVRKFNALGADIIVTYGASATLVALQEADDAPIVFADVYGPVETGIIRSNALASRNITGISSKVPMQTLLKAAMEIKPLKTLGILYNSREIGSAVQAQEVKRFAAMNGISVVEGNVATTSGLGNSLTSMCNGSVDMIFAADTYIVNRHFDKIVHQATGSKVPIISLNPDSAEKGALVSLEVSPVEQGQQAADLAVKILAGKKAKQLPTASAKKIDLIINLKTARTLDLHPSFQVLSNATRVIK